MPLQLFNREEHGMRGEFEGEEGLEAYAMLWTKGEFEGVPLTGLMDAAFRVGGYFLSGGC